MWLWNDATQSQRVYEQQATQKAENYREAARIRADSRCKALPREGIRECVQQAYDPARQGQHDEYDLQAQLVISAWTRAMGIAAIVGMTVGFLGVGLVFFTFNEAREANVIARNTAAKQLRPWLDYEDGRIEGKIGKDREFVLGIRNFGQSTASKVAIFAHLDILPLPFSKYVSQGMPAPTRDVPPGMSIALRTVAPDFLPNGHAAQIRITIRYEVSEGVMEEREHFLVCDDHELSKDRIRLLYPGDMKPKKGGKREA
ncbi:MAG TPA: hypothetical protein VN231_06130 [Allosphingosinicella sp.]|nr:hypothetical protein [Allosphingosinicella sp.]